MPLIAKGLFYYTETFLRLHMTKFLLGTIATLLLTLSFFIYKHNKTLQDLEHEKYKNLSLESKLQDSNKALEKIKLDTQNYLKARDKEIQVIQDKYTAILQDHKRKTQNIQESYESKLATLKSISKNLTHTQNLQKHSKLALSQMNGKENLHTKDISGLSPQHDNHTQQNLSYSENPNNSSSQVKLDNSNLQQDLQNENTLDSKQKSLNQDSKYHNLDYNTIFYQLQQCQAQIQTAKNMLRAFTSL